MGHYFHCVRVKAPNKDVACNYVENYVEDRAETKAIDYGFIMAVVDENGVISIEDKRYLNQDSELFSIKKLEEEMRERIPDSQLAIDKLNDLVNQLTPDNISTHVWDLENLFHDLRNSKTQAERDKFDVFKDTAYQGDLLSYGLTDLEEEGFAPSCYLDKDNEDVAKFKTFFVWVNSHM